MCEKSQWAHCVRIFLQLTQSHPIAPPPAGAEPGASAGAAQLRHKKNTQIIADEPQPRLTALTRYFLHLILSPNATQC